MKARVERRIAEYSSQLIPDFAAAVGVEAAAGKVHCITENCCTGTSRVAAGLSAGLRSGSLPLEWRLLGARAPPYEQQHQ